MVPSLSYLRSPPAETQRLIEDHRRWLETGGIQGVRIGSDDEETFFNPIGMSLDGIDLSLATLVFVNFSGASLRGASFIGADFLGATLVDCDLSGARFEDSDLVRADLTGADCRGACFDRADLRAARLIGVDCRGAQFDGANTGEILWTAEQAAAWEQKEKQRLVSLRDNRKNWTKAEWDAYNAKPDAETIRAAMEGGKARVRQKLEVWRRQTRKVPSLQP